MNETDFVWLSSALASVAVKDRVSVTVRRNSFTLHKPRIISAYGCDFAIGGERRRQYGDGQREFKMVRYQIAKVLRIEKGRLIVQDYLGNVMVMQAGDTAGEA